MKKKIIIFLILLLITIGSNIILKNIKHNNELKRYKQIKENVRKEAISYLTITSIPLKKGYEKYLYEDDIVNPLKRGADKKIIIDIDKKSYCKTAIKGFVKNNRWDAKVYIKCKKYEDKEYEDTLLILMCMNGVPKGYEEYYNKYGQEYDNLTCPKNIKDKIIELRKEN